MTPTGISSAKSRRDTLSASSSKTPPSNADKGISARLSELRAKRSKWGTIRPTKPMIPLTETQTAVISDAVIVGSALVRKIEENKDDANAITQAASELISGMRQAMDA